MSFICIFRPGYDFVHKAYHKCKLCGEEMLLCNDDIAKHVRNKHKISSSEYNTTHMTLKRDKKVRRNEDSSNDDNDKDRENNTKKVKLKNKDGIKVFGTPPQKKIAKVLPKAAETDKENTSSVPKPAKDTVAAADSDNESLADEEPFSKTWFDGNTFSCQKCDYSSVSLDRFKKHVKKIHSTTFLKFKGNFSQTNNMYECEFCAEEVSFNTKAMSLFDQIACFYLA